MVPIGKHIFSFGIISSVLSLVWYVINNKHAEDYIIIYLSNLGYKIYELLINKDLLANCSPKDVILHLSRIYKLRIEGKWILSEIPKKSRKILEKLDFAVHIT